MPPYVPKTNLEENRLKTREREKLRSEEDRKAHEEEKRYMEKKAEQAKQQTLRQEQQLEKKLDIFNRDQAKMYDDEYSEDLEMDEGEKEKKLKAMNESRRVRIDVNSKNQGSDFDWKKYLEKEDMQTKLEVHPNPGSMSSKFLENLTLSKLPPEERSIACFQMGIWTSGVALSQYKFPGLIETQRLSFCVPSIFLIRRLYYYFDDLCNKTGCDVVLKRRNSNSDDSNTDTRRRFKDWYELTEAEADHAAMMVFVFTGKTAYTQLATEPSLASAWAGKTYGANEELCKSLERNGDLVVREVVNQGKGSKTTSNLNADDAGDHGNGVTDKKSKKMLKKSDTAISNKSNKNQIKFASPPPNLSEFMLIKPASNNNHPDDCEIYIKKSHPASKILRAIDEKELIKSVPHYDPKTTDFLEYGPTYGICPFGIPVLAPKFKAQSRNIYNQVAMKKTWDEEKQEFVMKIDTSTNVLRQSQDTSWARYKHGVKKMWLTGFGEKKSYTFIRCNGKGVPPNMSQMEVFNGKKQRSFLAQYQYSPEDEFVFGIDRKGVCLGKKDFKLSGTRGIVNSIEGNNSEGKLNDDCEMNHSVGVESLSEEQSMITGLKATEKARVDNDIVDTSTVLNDELKKLTVSDASNNSNDNLNKDTSKPTTRSSDFASALDTYDLGCNDKDLQVLLCGQQPEERLGLTYILRTGEGFGDAEMENDEDVNDVEMENVDDSNNNSKSSGTFIPARVVKIIGEIKWNDSADSAKILTNQPDIRCPQNDQIHNPTKLLAESYVRLVSPVGPIYKVTNKVDKYIASDTNQELCTLTAIPESEISDPFTSYRKGPSKSSKSYSAFKDYYTNLQSSYKIIGKKFPKALYPLGKRGQARVLQGPPAYCTSLELDLYKKEAYDINCQNRLTNRIQRKVKKNDALWAMKILEQEMGNITEEITQNPRKAALRINYNINEYRKQIDNMKKDTSGKYSEEEIKEAESMLGQYFPYPTNHVGLKHFQLENLIIVGDEESDDDNPGQPSGKATKKLNARINVNLTKTQNVSKTDPVSGCKLGTIDTWINAQDAALDELNNMLKWVQDEEIREVNENGPNVKKRKVVNNMSKGRKSLGSGGKDDDLNTNTSNDQAESAAASSSTKIVKASKKAATKTAAVIPDHPLADHALNYNRHLMTYKPNWDRLYWIMDSTKVNTSYRAQVSTKSECMMVFGAGTGGLFDGDEPQLQRNTTKHPNLTRILVLTMMQEIHAQNGLIIHGVKATSGYHASLDEEKRPRPMPDVGGNNDTIVHDPRDLTFCSIQLAQSMKCMAHLDATARQQGVNYQYVVSPPKTHPYGVWMLENGQYYTGLEMKGGDVVVYPDADWQACTDIKKKYSLTVKKRKDRELEERKKKRMELEAQRLKEEEEAKKNGGVNNLNNGKSDKKKDNNKNDKKASKSKKDSKSNDNNALDTVEMDASKLGGNKDDSTKEEQELLDLYDQKLGREVVCPCKRKGAGFLAKEVYHMTEGWEFIGIEEHLKTVMVKGQEHKYLDEEWFTNPKNHEWSDKDKNYTKDGDKKNFTGDSNKLWISKPERYCCTFFMYDLSTKALGGKWDKDLEDRLVDLWMPVHQTKDLGNGRFEVHIGKSSK